MKFWGITKNTHLCHIISESVQFLNKKKSLVPRLYRTIDKRYSKKLFKQNKNGNDIL